MAHSNQVGDIQADESDVNKRGSLARGSLARGSLARGSLALRKASQAESTGSAAEAGYWLVDSPRTQTETSDAEAVPWCYSQRLTLVMVGFFGIVTMHDQRANLSMALNCMINHTALTESSPDTVAHSKQFEPEYDECAKANGSNTLFHFEGEFAWHPKTQGIMRSSYFWGYILTQIPGGWLAERYGGRRVLGSSILASSFVTLLSPICARLNPGLLIFNQIVLGICQGPVYPSMHFILSRWTPPLERSRLFGFTYAGGPMGNLVSLTLHGISCGEDESEWASIFYFGGSMGIIWCLCWFVMIKDLPEESHRITENERKYILDSVGMLEDRDEEREQRQSLGTPWKAMFQSRAVWSIIVAHACGSWALYTLLTFTPIYIREVLKIDIATNSVVSAFPYIFFWIDIVISGMLADRMKKNGWSTVAVRKLNTSLGMMLPGLLFMFLGQVSCQNPALGIGLLVLVNAFGGFRYTGYLVNHVDIAPPFCGVLVGISSTFATLAGIIAPLILSSINPNGYQSEGRYFFFTISFFNIAGAIIYDLFAEGEIQEWAKPFMRDESDDESFSYKPKLSKLASFTLSRGGRGSSITT